MFRRRRLGILLYQRLHGRHDVLFEHQPQDLRPRGQRLHHRHDDDDLYQRGLQRHRRLGILLHERLHRRDDILLFQHQAWRLFDRSQWLHGCLANHVLPK